MKQINICLMSDLVEGEPFQAIADGHDAFAVFRLGEEIRVTQDACPHAGASLSLEGQQDGNVVACGWHDATFDIRSGQALSGPCHTALRTYPAEVRDGEIVILIGEE